MSRRIDVLSPVGVKKAERRAIAPRVPTLKGAVVGLMDNSKPGGRQLLEGLREELAAEGVKGFLYRAKAHASGPSPYVQEVASACDAVVGALGD